MDITVHLDDETVARARALARRRATSLEGLVAELVAQACERGPGDIFVDLAQTHGGCSEPGWRFDREAAHER